MQKRVWEHLLKKWRISLGIEKPQPVDTQDFGFFNPEDAVSEAHNALTEYGVLPFAGGWFDQPETWRRDLDRMTALDAEAYLTVKPNHSEEWRGS